MARQNSISGDLSISGDCRIGGSITPAKAKSAILQQESAQAFPIPLTDFRTFDAMGTPLPSAGTQADDLWLVGGTHGTNTPTLQSDDHDSEGSPQKCYGRVLVQLPWEYVAGSAITLRFMAGMITNIADQAATTSLDCSVYKQEDDPDDAIGSDLCTTIAQIAVNSTTFANQDFTVTATGLSAGDILDVLITTAVDDDATGTAVIMGISWAHLLCDVR